MHTAVFTGFVSNLDLVFGPDGCNHLRYDYFSCMPHSAFPMEGLRKRNVQVGCLTFSNHGTPLPQKRIEKEEKTPQPRYLFSTLLSRRNQTTLRPRIVRPTTSQNRATALLCILLDTLLQLRPEVSDETLNWPCESLAESYRVIVRFLHGGIKGRMKTYHRWCDLQLASSAPATCRSPLHDLGRAGSGS